MKDIDDCTCSALVAGAGTGTMYNMDGVVGAGRERAEAERVERRLRKVETTLPQSQS